MFGYGTFVQIADGRTGMVVGRTTRGIRVNIDNSGGRINRGRNHEGDGLERTFKPSDLTIIPRA